MHRVRLWGIVRKNHKIIAQHIVPLTSTELGDIVEAMDQITHKLDLSRPMLLEKHEQELATYAKTSFLPRDFLEPVSLDRFEIEVLFDEKTQKRHSNDPRNDFSY